MEALQFWQHSPCVRLAVVMPRLSKRGMRYDLHAHTFHELGFLLEGECDWHVGGKRERLHAGDLLLVPAGVPHFESTSARGRARIGWLGFDFADGFLDVPAPLSAPLRAGGYEAELQRLLAAVTSEQQGAALGHVERAELALREILILLCRLRPAANRGSADTAGKTHGAPQLVRSAALTLEANLAQPMRIRDLANYHSLSASHFAVLFRRHQGETPRAFLQKARLRRAKVLLKRGDLTVKEIAAACGYVDAAHFCHAFKAATTLTPKQFRLRNAA